MLEQVNIFFNKEYEETKKFLEVIPGWAKPYEVVNNAITRCLGVAFFAQQCGYPFEEVDTLYSAIKEKLEKLLDNQ